MSFIQIPPNPKFSRGYTPGYRIKNSPRMNLLRVIDNSDIKNIIEEDVKKQIFPKKLNIDGVIFYEFNEPSHKEDFNKLINLYKEYYSDILPNNNYCKMHISKQNSFDKIKCIDYKRRRVRDFEFHLNTKKNKAVLNFFQKRIEHFDKCRQNLQQNPNYIQKYFDNELNLYNNNQANFDNMSVEQKNKYQNNPKKLKIFEIFKKFMKYFRIEKDSEKRILNDLNLRTQIILSNENMNNPDEAINRLFKNKLSELANIIQIGPKNKAFDPSPEKIEKCLQLKSSREEGKKKLGFNKQEQIDEFREIIINYILPQNKKVFLFGLNIYLFDFFAHCTSLVHAAPGFIFQDTGINIYNEKPYLQNYSPIGNKNVCHKYILWTPYLNYLYILIALKKNMDIPLMIFRPQYSHHSFGKITRKTTRSDLANTKFIGVLDIPYKENQRDLHHYIFVFESLNGKRFTDFMYSHSTPFLLLNKDTYIISQGLILPQNVISYDEVAYLYYLTKEQNINPYFYADQDHKDYIMVSTKNDLIEKRKNNGELKYPRLKKVILNEYRNNRGRKQFIFTYENSSLIDPNTKKIRQDITSEYLKTHKNDYLLMTTQIRNESL